MLIFTKEWTDFAADWHGWSVG